MEVASFRLEAARRMMAPQLSFSPPIMSTTAGAAGGLGSHRAEGGTATDGEGHGETSAYGGGGCSNID